MPLQFPNWTLDEYAIPTYDLGLYYNNLHTHLSMRGDGGAKYILHVFFPLWLKSNLILPTQRWETEEKPQLIKQNKNEKQSRPSFPLFFIFFPHSTEILIVIAI